MAHLAKSPNATELRVAYSGKKECASVANQSMMRNGVRLLQGSARRGQRLHPLARARTLDRRPRPAVLRAPLRRHVLIPQHRLGCCDLVWESIWISRTLARHFLLLNLFGSYSPPLAA
jgi:hypothetical protein